MLTHTHLDWQLLLGGRLHQVASDFHQSLFVFTGEHRLPQQPRRGRPEKQTNSTQELKGKEESLVFVHLGHDREFFLSNQKLFFF